MPPAASIIWKGIIPQNKLSISLQCHASLSHLLNTRLLMMILPLPAVLELHTKQQTTLSIALRETENIRVKN